jgi:V/A-type H+-transporting ATPase subunit E
MNELLGNLDDLVGQVHRRAEQRALSLRSSASDKAERILEEGRRRAAEERERIEAEGRRDADEACRQCLAVADLERRRRRLEAREARLEKVWTAAREQLSARAENGLAPEVLARLARHGAAQLGAEEVRVQLDAASREGVDADEVAGWAGEDGAALTLADEPLAERHGVVVRAGRASVDCTLEGRLDQARERLRGEIVELLEPEGDGTSSAEDDADDDAETRAAEREAGRDGDADAAEEGSS